jgi:PAS domain S-box-containing protein
LKDTDERIIGTLSIGEDVTDLRKAEQDLKDEKERMGVILGTLNTGLALLDKNLTVTWVNEMLQSFFPRMDLIGKKCYEVAEDSNEHCEGCGALKALSDGQVHETERFNAKIGRWVHIVSLPICDENGKITQVLEATTDITERKKVEEARDQYLEELRTLKEQLERENIYLKEEIESHHSFREIIGESRALLYVLTRVKQVAETDTTVLIQGETGVGKELIARAIHRTGPRADKPFIHLNCAALPVNLVESELFGHEAGAFTGADRLRRGRFELAHGGTIFLDEVSEMPLDVQAKLLRVLQEGQFERIGGSKTLKVHVRIITSTNRELQNEVASGRFRQDLFYRLNVYPITVPPLRKRKEDIPLLVTHFLSEIGKTLGKKIDQIPPAVMKTLTAYDWPGNVRELRNVLERAIIISPGSTLYLPERLGSAESSSIQGEALDTREPLESVERKHILRVLDATGWRISGPKGAAKILGLNPSTLRFRMKKLGIETRQSKSR